MPTESRPPVKLLFICSENLHRSPTAEEVYGARPGFQARSRGTWSSARSRLTGEDLEWADLVLVMQPDHAYDIEEEYSDWWMERGDIVEILGIEDEYEYMDPKLVRVIVEKCDTVLRRRGYLG